MLYMNPRIGKILHLKFDPLVHLQAHLIYNGLQTIQVV